MRGNNHDGRHPRRRPLQTRERRRRRRFRRRRRGTRRRRHRPARDLPPPLESLRAPRCPMALPGPPHLAPPRLPRRQRQTAQGGGVWTFPPDHGPPLPRPDPPPRNPRPCPRRPTLAGPAPAPVPRRPGGARRRRAPPRRLPAAAPPGPPEDRGRRVPRPPARAGPVHRPAGDRAQHGVQRTDDLLRQPGRSRHRGVLHDPAQHRRQSGGHLARQRGHVSGGEVHHAACVSRGPVREGSVRGGEGRLLSSAAYIQRAGDSVDADDGQEGQLARQSAGGSLVDALRGRFLSER
mmetsp:Transcript_6508/g.14063  ORF Transcript_6508/g.14063 Transcript_6508/m.14063 type:complete len:292 (-) Transcript_6508:67-942(-)